jgi:predicted acylesterase/phospholipase RssA
MQLTKSHMLMRVIGVCCLIVLSACVGRPAESLGIRGLTPNEAVAVNDVETGNRNVSLAKANGHMTILALSGGGADGAYGVGVLNGWTKTGRRPKFDIVTGVSTGALMSVFAFLGPQYDAMLEDLYVNPEEKDILRNRGVAGFFQDSLYDNSPLKRRIEKYMTPELLDLVAAEHAKGRRLYVATTNLDSKELVVWDMGLLASGGAEGRTNSLQLFQKVLRASAAIPVLFPPVYIKPKRGVQLRQAHVDGGVKAPVLISDFLFDSTAQSRELFVIINGSLALEETFEAVQPGIRDIATKSTGTLTRELTQQVVYRGYVRAQNSGTDFRLTAIPSDVKPPNSAIEFDREHLRRIYDIGYKTVQEPGFWWDSPPTLKKYDRIARR